MKTRTVGLVLALGALACQGDRQDRAGLQSAVGDSAGIRIVENARPPEGSRLGWRIGAEPAVSIGVPEGEEPYMLDQVTDATRLGDGRVVVANAGTAELRVFDASGQHLATWGRAGEGPSDFSRLVHVGTWPGDSITAWYTGSAGIAVYDGRGRFGRIFALRNGESVGGPRPRPVGMAAGSILSVRPVEEADSAIVEIWDGDGVLSVSLGTHPAVEIVAITDERGAQYNEPLGYGRQLVTGLWGDLVVVSPTTHYEIHAFRGDGSLHRVVRRDHVLRSPSEADREPYVEESMVHILATPGLPEQMVEMARTQFHRIPFADYFPAFSSVLGDATGHLWVQEYEYPREARPGSLWTVFDPEGHVLGFVETPEELQIYEIGEDYILGRAEDELGVESIQLWLLERSEGVAPP